MISDINCHTNGNNEDEFDMARSVVPISQHENKTYLLKSDCGEKIKTASAIKAIP
ncbi:hypothetical protein ACSO1_35530 [Acinetobacter calcoaceticus]|nr:hypothetical protein ACSO1_35530 [Acinetobacter calcoaceticus]